MMNAPPRMPGPPHLMNQLPPPVQRMQHPPQSIHQMPPGPGGGQQFPPFNYPPPIDR
jgi:hypothetical protein